MRERDGGEAGLERRRHDLEVVDPHDRTVARHDESQRGCRLVRAHRHLVVEAEQGGGPLGGRTVEQATTGGASARRVRGAALHEHREGARHGEPCIGERRTEPRLPPAGRQRVIRRRHHRNAPVARREEMRDRRCGDAVLVRGDRRHPPSVRGHRVDEHDRRVAERLGTGDLLMEHARHEDSVNAMVGERAQLPRLETGIALGVDDHEHGVALARGVLSPLHDAARERRGRDAVAREADDARALQAQSARKPIRGVTELRRRTDDALPRLGAHGASAAQRVRHRGRGDPCCRCDRRDARPAVAARARHPPLRTSFTHVHRAYDARPRRPSIAPSAC